MNTYYKIVTAIATAVAFAFIARMLFIGAAISTVNQQVNQLQNVVKDLGEKRTREIQERAKTDAKSLEVAQARLDEADRIKTAQKRREVKLLTPECRFWWEQNENSPTARTAEKKNEFCEL